MKVTIKDLAKELGLSPSTVSRALSGNENIKPATIERVKKLAKDLQYRPNTWASALRTKKTKMIGVIVPSLKNPFFAHAISAIQDVVNVKGYHVMVCQSKEQMDLETDQLNKLVASGVEGVLISIANESKAQDSIYQLEEMGVPLVFFDRAFKSFTANQVEADDFKAGLKATEHLIGLGCKHIMHLAGPGNLRNCNNRKEGYLHALKKHNIPVKDELIIEVSLESDDLRIEDVSKILSMEPTVDGVFAVSDPIAVQTITHMKKLGVRIPQEIKLVGFGGDPIGLIVEPSLTTLTQNPHLMGEEAVKLLMDVMDNEGVAKSVRQITVDTELIIRQSTVSGKKSTET